MLLDVYLEHGEINAYCRELRFSLYDYVEKVMVIKWEMELYRIKGNSHVIKVLFKNGTNASATHLWTLINGRPLRANPWHLVW